ncbi:11667_t:CDS:1, partial [Gigaspora margarita]
FRRLYGTEVFGFRYNFYISACLENDFVVASTVLSTKLVDFGIALE